MPVGEYDPAAAIRSLAARPQPDPNQTNPVMHPASLMGKTTNVPTPGMAAAGMRAPTGEDPHAGPALHPAPPRVVGRAAFEQQQRTSPAMSAASPVGAVKTSAQARHGFMDELAKEAGLRDVVRRIVSGRDPAKMKLGFFERRRMAKSLGVKPHQVEQAMQQRQRVGKAMKTSRVAGIAGVGALAGAKLSRESDNE